MSDYYLDILAAIQYHETQVHQHEKAINLIEREFTRDHSPLAPGTILQVRCNGKLAPCRVERVLLDRLTYSDLDLPVSYGFKVHLTVMTASGEPNKLYTGTITRGMYMDKFGLWLMHGQHTGDQFGKELGTGGVSIQPKTQKKD